MDAVTRVLLVDDEEIYAESLAKVLKRRGMEVSIASDGLTALKWIQENEADVIVLDLKMPGMDGIQTLYGIRERDDTTPVIMLTGHIDIPKVTQALEGGVGEILLKPCPIESLVTAIENARERKRALKDLKMRTKAQEPEAEGT